MSRGLGSSSQERPCPGPDPGPWPPGWPEEGEGADTVPLGKRMISGLQGKGVGAEPAKSRATELVMTFRHLLSPETHPSQTGGRLYLWMKAGLPTHDW